MIDSELPAGQRVLQNLRPHRHDAHAMPTNVTAATDIAVADAASTVRPPISSTSGVRKLPAMRPKADQGSNRAGNSEKPPTKQAAISASEP